MLVDLFSLRFFFGTNHRGTEDTEEEKEREDLEDDY